MKAMIMSDLLIAKKYLLQQLGVSIAVGIFIKRTLKGHKYHPPVDPTTCEPLEDKDGKA